MADYKKVVEMLGENLASFLELVKKLLIDWKVEPKKLLHTLQNFRKEELLGLIAGTHEIKQIKKMETKPVEKFVLLADLGEIVAPDDFDSNACCTAFYKKCGIEKNFPSPTRILKPGDKLYARIFKQNVSGFTTSEERMEFLATQNAVHIGAQCPSLIVKQKGDKLPKSKGYCSFDEKDRLWEDSGGYHRVPCVYANSDGGFNFHLGSFEHDWGGDACLLCFCDLPATKQV